MINVCTTIIAQPRTKTQHDDDSCTSPFDSTEGIVFSARSEALEAPGFFRHLTILSRSAAILEMRVHNIYQVGSHVMIWEYQRTPVAVLANRTNERTSERGVPLSSGEEWS